MPFWRGAFNTSSFWTGNPQAGTIRVNSPVKIGVQGQPDFVSTFTGALARGHLTIAGKTLVIGRLSAVTRGHLTVRGKSVGQWGSSAWQYITITTLTSIGSSRTLYDSIDPAFNLIPAVGDVWRVPRFSTDGGAVVVSGDGRFEIGAPTQGIDTLPAVMYYNLINAVWYGPADFTILNPALILSLLRGHLSINGKALSSNITRPMAKGRLSIFGHQVQWRRQYPLQTGHLTITGRPTKLSRQMSIQTGHLTVSGKALTLTHRLTLLIDPGHLTVAGKAQLLTRALAISTGHLTLSGKAVTLFTGLPLFMDPGHLRVTGSELRFGRALLVQPGHLTIHGRTILQKTTGAIGVIDKPSIVGRRKRRNIRSSQA